MILSFLLEIYILKELAAKITLKVEKLLVSLKSQAKILAFI
jgi:hypothetical protein